MRACMRSLAAAVVCLLSVAAQAQTASPGDQTFGMMNKRTGVFTPLPAGSGAPGTTPTTGTVKVSVRGAISPGLPFPSQIFCRFGVVIYTTAGPSFGQVKSQTARAATSGSTFTCSMTMGYSVLVDLQTMQPTLTISLEEVFSVDSSYSVAIRGTSPARDWTSATENTVTMKLPANGVTTTQNFWLDF